jgi:predicted Zn-dependent protease
MLTRVLGALRVTRRKAAGMLSRTAVPASSLATSVGILLTGCVGPANEWLLPSLEEDRRLGLQVVQQVQAEMGFVDHAEAAAYLNSVGQRVCQSIPDRRFDYSFRIVDQAEPNAFAAPGGYVFASRGLLACVVSEDELANVLAHEVVHVARRHTSKQMAKQRVPNLLALPGRAVGRVVNQDLGRLLNAPVNTFGSAFLAAYSREDELEADRVGQRLAATAGYDPEALGAALGRLESEEHLRTHAKRRAGFFDTHPMTPQRVGRITRYSRDLQWTRQPGVAQNQADFLSNLDGLIVGEDPANGVFRGQRFLHPELDFFIELPAGWNTMNTREAVGAFAPTKDAVVFLGVHGRGTDPAAVGHAFAGALRSEYDVEPSRSEAVTFGEWPGYVVTITDATGREPMHMFFVWIACRGLVCQLIGVAPERYREPLRGTAQSLRPLTSRERSSIKVTRLRVASAKDGEDLSRLSERTGNAWDLPMTAVLNGLSEGTSLAAGQLVKIAVVRKQARLLTRKVSARECTNSSGCVFGAGAADGQPCVT